MSWLAPGFLAAGALAALAVVALHLLAWRRPPAAPLPTARFVPDAPARARARSPRLADPWLLALRVLALLLAGAALARPVRVAERRPVAQVVVADLSASVANAAEVRRQAAMATQEGDALVVMDSVARLVASDDSMPARASTHIGSLSAALIKARDAVRELAERADSAVLVVVSPLAREEVDAATAGLAAAWNGRVLLHYVAPAGAGGGAPVPIEFEAEGDDPVAAGARASAVRTTTGARFVRRAPTSDDSAWVRAVRGRVLVSWPAAVAPADAPAAALAWGDDALVAPLARDGAEPAGRTIVRWADGRPAAAERPVGDGCIREVRVALPRAGDVTLSTSFARLLAGLATPCGGVRDSTRVAPESLGFRRSGAALALPRPAPRDPWSLSRWLLWAAIVLLLLEPLLRRSSDERWVTRAGVPDAPRAEAA